MLPKKKPAGKKGRFKRKILIGTAIAALTAGCVSSRESRPVSKVHVSRPVARAEFRASGQWPEILKILRWDPNHSFYKPKINFINKIAGNANASPAEVICTVKIRGITWYHSRVLRKRLTSLEKEIPGSNGVNLAKLKQEKARLKRDIAIIDAIVAEEKASKEMERVAIDSVNALKGNFFITKKIEALIKEK